MYYDLKNAYWWSGMKRDILEFVTKCMVWKKGKLQHQVPSRLLQPIKYPSGNGMNHNGFCGRVTSDRKKA